MEQLYANVTRVLLCQLNRLTKFLPKLPPELHREAVEWLCVLTRDIRLTIIPRLSTCELLENVVQEFQLALDAVDALQVRDEKVAEYRRQIASRLQMFQDEVAKKQVAVE